MFRMSEPREVAPGIYRGTITPEPEKAEYELIEVIAAIEERQIEALPSLYEEVNHMISSMFKTPPSDEAQVEVGFSFSGLRVHLDHAGNYEITDVKRTIDDL
jgi:hypothetical protein